MAVRGQNEDTRPLNRDSNEDLQLHFCQINRVSLDDWRRLSIRFPSVWQTGLLVQVPELEMLEAARDEKVLFRRNLNLGRRLRKEVLADFCLVAPVPDEKAAIVGVTQRDQEVVPWGEEHLLDAVLVALQVTHLIVGYGFFDDDDFLGCVWSSLIASLHR